VVVGITKRWVVGWGACKKLLPSQRRPTNIIIIITRRRKKEEENTLTLCRSRCSCWWVGGYGREDGCTEKYHKNKISSNQFDVVAAVVVSVHYTTVRRSEGGLPDMMMIASGAAAATPKRK